MNYYNDIDEDEDDDENNKSYIKRECIDINILLDKLDNIIADYSYEYELSCIFICDFLYPNTYKMPGLKHNKIIYELSTAIHGCITDHLENLTDEDYDIFEKMTHKRIYMRLLNNIKYKFVQPQLSLQN